jgi:type II secretory ATPase GspE/PulE/Tfp pilus assembly ATPase PilB-like protein
MNNMDSTLQHLAKEDEEKAAQTLAQSLGLPYINLNGYPVEPKILKIVSEDKARSLRIICYLRDREGKLKILTDNPQNTQIQPYLQDLSQSTREELLLTLGSKSSVDYGLGLYAKLAPEKAADDAVHVTQKLEEQFESGIQNLQELKGKISEVSTSDVLELIFAGAIKNDASDVHLEPEEDDVRVRYRIDGVLQDIADLPSVTYKQIINRIKFLSKLKLDVSHPQDGRFTIDVLGEEVDIRVATLPATYGEAVVMRLLPKKKSFLTLDNLGFRPDAQAAIEEATSKPQGLVLNTGPTGSGKSTTLYAILQKLNKPERKIITMENPVEYRINGIEQIQVDTENETAFLDILKGSLRQDPDIMMIGEIRDGESAGIALQAAMTGHLVLSTLHTNNAPSAFARLAEIGVPPYLMGGTINLIIAQRLVRKIHTECGGKGCIICHNSGYKGRVALVEVLKPTAEIEDLIQRKAPIREFEEVAKKIGMKTMYQDGLEKVAAGVTTMDEVNRVTQE